MMQAEIRDLGLIGDQKTVAVLDRWGSILWYCPRRFDYASLFAALLDSDKGGVWDIQLPHAVATGRRYVGDSAILETSLSLQGHPFTITDCMPAGNSSPSGICRRFSIAPGDTKIDLSPSPNYARDSLKLEITGRGVCINGQHWLYASHPLSVNNQTASFKLPKGESGWAVLVDEAIEHPSASLLESWYNSTLSYWDEIVTRIHYEGPYVRQIADSLRALRLLTYAPNGGVIAVNRDPRPH
jgi:hypothetical protein